MNIGIEYIQYYIPENRMTVYEYYEELRKKSNYQITDSEINNFISTSRYREVAVENKKNRVEMLECVLGKILQYCEPKDIDYVIYATDIPESYRDKIVYQLKLLKDFGLENANYFTLNQQCGTQIIAVRIADSLIKTGAANKVLIVSHSYKEEIGKRLLEGYGIIGDGAVAAIVSKNASKLRIVASNTYVNNKYFDLNRTPKNGLAYYEYLQNGVQGIRDTFNEEVELSNISLIIPQNVSALEWDFYCRRLMFNKEKVFLENIGKYGHLGDADAFVNLCDVVNGNILKKNDYVLLQSVGAGATFNTLLLQY